MPDFALTLYDVAVRGLRGVSLAIMPGEITGVVGSAGAGKTTLLQVAAGCLRPTRGEAWVWGARLTDAAARRFIGYAPDHPAFPRALRAGEVLLYYARLHAAAHPERAPLCLVREAQELAGLGAAADLLVSELGHADMQRLALAQALLGRRRVLVLDEFFTQLDAIARRDLRGRIARLAADGVAVLIAARDPAALERLAARALVLREGRVVRAGTLPALLGERVLEVILDAPPREPPPGFRVTDAGLEAPLAGRTVESALALCRAHRLAVRASRVRVKSLEEIVLETQDTD
jgi:ABC-type multidrug transport system ATPase subunit